MFDRLVRKVNSKQESAHFSSCLSSDKIILLGDPGSGKSHLFNTFSQEEGASLFSARDFLNLSPARRSGISSLYIDALDERRSGRADHSTVDEMILALGQMELSKVRISCRAADWLGDVDLSAFQNCLPGDDVVVLSLEPLSDEEIIDILTTKSVPNPSVFLTEASENHLDELLRNPQSLIMLIDVVKDGGWPDNKTELFEKAITVLLTEQKSDVSRDNSRSYLPQSLIDAAGAICSVRLISDLNGISLSDSDIDTETPSCARISLSPIGEVKAALSRRIFTSKGRSGHVDYVHRTIAEYLAARWISKQINNGLPIGRVLGLIGFEGRPTTELRGLSAWLPSFLPRYEQQIITSDPFGILSYGDASSLTLNGKRFLLSSLAQLAESDPDFLGASWEIPGVRGLSDLELAGDIKEILLNKKSSFAIRYLILMALKVSPVTGELNEIVLDIIASSASTYAERSLGVDCLVNSSEEALSALVTLYPSLDSTPDELRLRAKFIEELYDKGLGVEHLCSLMVASIGSKERLISGALWFVPNYVPDSNIPEIINCFFSEMELQEKDQDDLRHRNSNSIEVMNVIDKFLVGYVERFPKINHCDMWHWLKLRHRFFSTIYNSFSDQLAQTLSSNAGIHEALVSEAVLDLRQYNNPWDFIAYFDQITLSSVPKEAIFDVIKYLFFNEPGNDTELLFGASVALCIYIGPQRMEDFESLEAASKSNAGLDEIFRHQSTSALAKWRLKEAVDKSVKDHKYHLEKTKRIRDFERNKAAIQAGEHIGWLLNIARIYFCRFADLSEEATPFERLVDQLGEENAQIGINGLVSLISKATITPLHQVISAHLSGHSRNIYLALMAGITEYFKIYGNFSSLSNDNIYALLTINCLHPSFVCEDGVTHEMHHKWVAYLVNAQPDIVSDAYLGLIREDISHKVDHNRGLIAFLQSKELKPFHGDAIIKLLSDYPEMDSRTTGQLVRALDGISYLDKLSAIARKGIEVCSNPDNRESYLTWLAVGFYVAPESFENVMGGLDDEKDIKAIIWFFRDISGVGGDGGRWRLRLRHAQWLITQIARYFDRSGFPDDGIYGDKSSWDATRFLQNLIGLVSGDISDEGVNLLQSFLDESELKEYRQDIKHGLAEQTSKRVDTLFSQPDLNQAICVLSNNAPINAQDLHSLVVSHLEDLQKDIAGSNANIFRQFWNEDQYCRITTPKPEDSGRDALIQLLRPLLEPHKVLVEPESEMVESKSADIGFYIGNVKLVIELKRHYHKDVWTAMNNQLDGMYTRDPACGGYGIYGVLWFGQAINKQLPKPPAEMIKPTSVSAMQQALNQVVPANRRNKLTPIVIDVSQPELRTVE